MVGTGPAGLTVKIFEGTTELGSGVVQANGTYSITLTAGLALGDHQIKASAFDSQGVSMGYTGEQTIHVVPVGPQMINMSAFPTPLMNPLTTLWVKMDVAAQLSSFIWEDVTLTRDGGANLINAGSGVTVTQVPGNPLVYSVNFPGALTLAAGTYTLTVKGQNVVSQSGPSFVNNRSTSWTMLPIVTGMNGYSAGLTSPLTKNAIRFGTAINASTFTASDLELKVNGTIVDVSAVTISVSPTDPLLYFINMPASLTTAPGNYQLTVTGAGIQTVSGTPFANNGVSTWTMLPIVVGMNSYPTPQTRALTQNAIRFTTPIDLSTFTWADLTLTRDGGSNLIGAASGVTVTQFASDPTIYLINMPAALTTAAGAYRLTVGGNGIKTLDGTAVGNNGVSTWTMAPIVASFNSYPTPLSAALTQNVVRFNTGINASTFDWHDLTLTRDGGAPLDVSGVTVVQSGTDPSLFYINMPSALTTTPGNYQLTVTGAGVQSTGGVAVANTATGLWTMAPSIVGMNSYANPLTAPLTQNAIRFNTTINLTTFTWQDMILTRDGGPNLINASSGMTVVQSGVNPMVYLINMPAALTSTPGTYRLTIVGSGINSDQNKAFINNAQSVWILTTV